VTDPYNNIVPPSSVNPLAEQYKKNYIARSADSQYDSMLFTTKYKIKNYTRVPNTPEEKCYYTKNFNTILKANKMY